MTFHFALLGQSFMFYYVFYCVCCNMRRCTGMGWFFVDSFILSCFRCFGFIMPCCFVLF